MRRNLRTINDQLINTEAYLFKTKQDLLAKQQGLKKKQKDLKKIINKQNQANRKYKTDSNTLVKSPKKLDDECKKVTDALEALQKEEKEFEEDIARIPEVHPELIAESKNTNENEFAQRMLSPFIAQKPLQALILSYLPIMFSTPIPKLIYSSIDKHEHDDRTHLVISFYVLEGLYRVRLYIESFKRTNHQKLLERAERISSIPDLYKILVQFRKNDHLDLHELDLLEKEDKAFAQEVKAYNLSSQARMIFRNNHNLVCNRSDFYRNTLCPKQRAIKVARAKEEEPDAAMDAEKIPDAILNPVTRTETRSNLFDESDSGSDITQPVALSPISRAKTEVMEDETSELMRAQTKILEEDSDSSSEDLQSSNSFNSSSSASSSSVSSSPLKRKSTGEAKDCPPTKKKRLLPAFLLNIETKNNSSSASSSNSNSSGLPLSSMKSTAEEGKARRTLPKRWKSKKDPSQVLVEESKKDSSNLKRKSSGPLPEEHKREKRQKRHNNKNFNANLSSLLFKTKKSSSSDQQLRRSPRFAPKNN